MLTQLDALRNVEGSLAALCDIDRLVREFIARVSTTGSPADITQMEILTGVGAILQTAPYDVKQGS